MKSKSNSLILLVTAALTLLAGPASAVVYYVDGENGTDPNDGLTWDTAKATIQAAVDAVGADDEIWVKMGTYTISSQIQVDEAIGIYGGFAGSEIERSQRDWANNTTTIDGQDITRILSLTDEPTIDGFTLTNGYFTGSFGGGAVYIGGIASWNKTARISNCIMSNNYVNADPVGGEGLRGGGAIFLGQGEPVFTNCLIINNSTNAYGGGINIYSGSPDFVNCTISKNSAVMGGGLYMQGKDTVIDAQFYNCIVSGNTDANDVRVHPEGDDPTGSNNCSSVQIGTGTILADPLFINPDSNNFHLKVDSACIDAGTDSVTLADTDLDMNARVIDGDNDTSAIVDIGAYEATEILPDNVLCVDAAALPGGDGSSWTRAFNDIQDTINAAAGAVNEIWVKMGLYQPSTRINVNKTISIYGGFAGDESQRDDRNWETNTTTIDGQDSILHFLNITADATVDGLTITGGYAQGSFPNDDGGGIYIDDADPTIINCTITANHSEYRGGGIYAESFNGSIINCTFSNNTAGSAGGAIYNYQSSPAITDCEFLNNAGSSGASTSGGAIYNKDSTPTTTITNCIFTGNNATNGGGILNSNSDAIITDCTFSGSTDSGSGGAIYNYTCSPTISRCVISENDARSGGGIFNRGTSSSSECNPIITNCIIYNNSATLFYGGGIYNDSYSNAVITNCTIVGNDAANSGGAIYNSWASPTLTNCILWYNDAPSNPVIRNYYGISPVVANYCDIEGGYGGTNNKNVDPNFVNAASGNLRLNPGSKCIDAGDNSAPSIPTTDYDGNDRIIDGDSNGSVIVDIGAYEFTLSGVVVPTVLNMTEAAAETTLNTAGLIKGTVTHDYSDTIDAGLVMDQDPDAGTNVPDSSAVDLVISDGPCTTDVPNVLNMTEAAAEAAIIAAGLVKGTVTTDYSDTVDAGSVMDQEPDADETVACGSAVDLVISDGPCEVDVPNVLNMTEANAEAALIGASLVKGAVTYAYSDTVAAGLVISHTPTAGTSVDCDTSVDLVISLGPCLADVPNVLNMTEATAEAAIASAGLVKGTVTHDYSDTVDAGSVMDQEPDAEETVACGSSVDLVISDGPCLVSVPNVSDMTEGNAEAALTGAGLVKGDVTHQYSGTVAAGLVMGQSPAAATSVPCGASVDLIISDGPCMADVPNVLNMIEGAAETLLIADGFVKGAVSNDYSDTVDEGLVMGQDPANGESVLCGSAINLIISLGPCIVDVPDVSNITEVDAESALNALGLTKGTVTSAYSNTVAEGLVMTQTPDAAIPLPCGAAVDLVISDGPPIVPNDLCDNPDTLTASIDYPGTTLEATGAIECSCADNDTQDVWYSYTPAADGLVNITLTGSDFDTTLAVYDSCNTEELACNDDFGHPDIDSQVALYLAQGATYLIRVAGYDYQGGDFTISIDDDPPGLDNDTCLGAIPVEPNEVYLGTTVEATGTSESGCSYNDILDTWHSFTPQANVLAEISLCGSHFDTTLAIYDECDDRQLACNDDYCGLQSQLTVNLTANNSYRIRVAGYDGEMGDYTLTITELPGWKPDFNADGIVDYGDFAILAMYWQTNRPSVDIAPEGGDGIINMSDVIELALHWLK